MSGVVPWKEMRGSTAAAARRSNRCPIVAGCRGRPYGRLVCPWHQSAYDVDNGQMVRGPQQIFAKIPGLGTTFKMLTKVWPLGRGTVSVSGNDIVVE